MKVGTAVSSRFCTFTVCGLQKINAHASVCAVILCTLVHSYT